MSKSRHPVKVQAVGGGPSLEGRHARLSLTTRPVWHPDDQGRLACAGADQLLSFDLLLPPGLADAAVLRGACGQMVRRPVEVRLPGLHFQGHVVSCVWSEEADHVGGCARAVVALSIQGQEASS